MICLLPTSLVSSPTKQSLTQSTPSPWPLGSFLNTSVLQYLRPFALVGPLSETLAPLSSHGWPSHVSIQQSPSEALPDHILRISISAATPIFHIPLHTFLLYFALITTQNTVLFIYFIHHLCLTIERKLHKSKGFLALLFMNESLLQCPAWHPVHSCGTCKHQKRSSRHSNG